MLNTTSEKQTSQSKTSRLVSKYFLNPGKNYLKFTFSRAGTVSVTIKKEKTEMVCELVQEKIPKDEDGKPIFMSVVWRDGLFIFKLEIDSGRRLRSEKQKHGSGKRD